MGIGKAILALAVLGGGAAFWLTLPDPLEPRRSRG